MYGEGGNFLITLPCVTSSGDLVTSYEATRAGFVALALERNQRATPSVTEARALKSVASHARSPAELLSMHEIRPALLTAAGISDKAARYLQQEDKDKAIERLVAEFLEPAGEAFVEELVYRFLLTKGDTLGGSMRNLGGAIAKQKFGSAILGALSVVGIRSYWLPRGGHEWLPVTIGSPGLEKQLRGLAWTVQGEPRTMLYDLKVPIVATNVDVCLYRCSHTNCDAVAWANPAMYVALGELKGGIDPAGADEHWKTARTALARVRERFAAHEQSPSTFFVGAAIVSKMAEEIWRQIQERTLTYAANLTNDDQVADLCRWLTSL